MGFDEINSMGAIRIWVRILYSFICSEERDSTEAPFTTQWKYLLLDAFTSSYFLGQGYPETRAGFPLEEYGGRLCVTKRTGAEAQSGTPCWRGLLLFCTLQIIWSSTIRAKTHTRSTWKRCRTRSGTFCHTESPVPKRMLLLNFLRFFLSAVSLRSRKKE